MASFTKLLSSVMVALLYASATSAMPWPASSKHATHRTRAVGPNGNLQLETFHPESTFETFGVEGIDHPLSRRDDAFDIKDASVSFLTSKLGISKDSVNFRTSAEAQVSQHAFLQQQINGVPFANAVANVAFSNTGKVVSFSSSFVKPTKAASPDPTVSLDDAIKTAEEALGGTFNGHPATLEFLAQADGSAALTHVVQIQNESTGAWFEAFVDAHANKLLSVTDFVAKASYRVLPINEEILTQGFQVLTDPQDVTASPDGWHSDGTTTTTTTAGNNAIAFKGSQTTGVTTESSSGLNFIFTQNASAAPTTATNIAAAVTNAFYIVNSIHDLSYKYGFTEATFNFQNNNFGKGGKGNDRVTISVQDPAGTDNADFSTPADGQSGAMRMFLWDLTNPERDGALENDIVSHENTHGITNRMTGGGTGRCLQTTEAGGMGEGWSDTMADWNEQGATTQDFVLGQYVTNDPAGIRTHPYSTSATTNPLRYSSLKTLTEVHDIGEVWANILHNVYASLVQAHGWSATARTDPTTSEGNVVFMHLFIDSLLLQPCNPTFLTARNAWIQADANRFGGANKCLLWDAFASRGLGVNAANHNDDSTVPAGC
ncbi:Fungalysin metallopeptidase-domain-containing protein [Gloeopeniophorella convolvens]|nr:Fungalysin metallopeptidase-domain-containing protein [Gloeopeniophorella convolvens]